MTIDQLSATRLVIVLSKKDMGVFALDYNSIYLENEIFQRVLKRLVAIARERITIPLQNKALLVEAIERFDGCILLITVLPKHGVAAKRYKLKRGVGEIMLSFACADDFTDCMAQLYKNGFRLLRGEAYRNNGEYNLIIAKALKLSSRALGLMSEYSSDVCENEIKISLTREHGARLAAGFPVMKIGEVFAVNS
ncbi:MULTISPECIES: hypothetical protein [unclassified Ruminococcus]|uniref:hypothetical protein n=1 Tax=unclassified Ruminococcus TaxID=2608920 RepID=UPI00210922C4|nr:MULTISPECIES: hypothetical protein [unclassified Ruminococcus]MCQ4023040.1 hypothetical protein [Ruminococcus sp. zg-924]MCQ4115477.1 hypothetical protein [Ruminococcus sp. zg-921]